MHTDKSLIIYQRKRRKLRRLVLKIAQPFMAGETSHQKIKVPPGTKEIPSASPAVNEDCAVLAGLGDGLGLNPALKRWAIFMNL
jgi:hypothetical protein